VVRVGGARWQLVGPPDFDTWVLHRGASLLRFAYLLTRDHGRVEEAIQDGTVRRRPVRRGCKRNGTDEGSVVRQLTSSAAEQIFIGVHEPDGLNVVLYQLLVGPPPPVI
jgi:hypothetical protein